MAGTLRKKKLRKKYLRKNTLRKKSTKRKYTNRRSIKRKSYKKKIKGGLIGTRCAENFIQYRNDRQHPQHNLYHNYIRDVINKSKYLHDYSIYVIAPFKDDKDFEVGLRFNIIQKLKSQLMKVLKKKKDKGKLNLKKYAAEAIKQLKSKKLSFIYWGNKGLCEKRYDEIQEFFKWIDEIALSSDLKIFNRDEVPHYRKTILDSLIKANQLDKVS